RPLVEEFPRVPAYQVELAAGEEKLARLLRGRRDFAAARPLLEGAVSHLRAGMTIDARSASREFLSSCAWLLADTLLLLGEYRAAAGIADELPGICPDRWQECYQAARLLTRCVSAAGQDSAAPRGELTEQYSRKAVALLRQARSRGYADVGFLKTDPGLDVLRGREDFSRMLGESQAPP
ncbi:MAG TPA: hypothetical protein VFW33_23655, partial [Gemmataceae bacterium]|nr:hypothetical protein [Gemmataceae bacterium]